MNAVSENFSNKCLKVTVLPNVKQLLNFPWNGATVAANIFLGTKGRRPTRLEWACRCRSADGDGSHSRRPLLRQTHQAWRCHRNRVNTRVVRSSRKCLPIASETDSERLAGACETSGDLQRHERPRAIRRLNSGKDSERWSKCWTARIRKGPRFSDLTKIFSRRRSRTSWARRRTARRRRRGVSWIVWLWLEHSRHAGRSSRKSRADTTISENKRIFSTNHEKLAKSKKKCFDVGKFLESKVFFLKRSLILKYLLLIYHFIA